MRGYYERSRVLPAAIFDALQASVTKHGGTGTETLTFGIGQWSPDGIYPTLDDLAAGDARPCCIHGHAIAVDGKLGLTPTRQALNAVGLAAIENDRIVRDYNIARGQPADTMLTWDEFVSATHIERGDA